MSRKFKVMFCGFNVINVDHVVIPQTRKNNRAFSHDVTAAILVFQNNKTAAMLVYQTSPVGIELFSYVNRLSFVPINLHSRWPLE